MLWLLPYLVFSVASDGFHSHDWASLSKVPKTTQVKSNHHSILTSATKQATNHTECFACDWAANSASYLVSPSLQTVTHSTCTTPTPFLFSLTTSLARCRKIRGPPLS